MPMQLVIYVVGGTCGTGKTTIAIRLQEWFIGRGIPASFIEGDDLHPTSNIQKMSSGIPLTDEDRIPWLHEVSDVSYARSKEFGRSVITCSSLKKQYRTLIRERHTDARFIFFMLHGSKQEINRRMLARESHFMKADMVNSQFEDLQLPTPEELDSFVIDVTTKSIEETAHSIESKIVIH